MRLAFDAKMDFREFEARFGSEEACIQALQHARWPDGFRCPRCQHTEASVVSTRKLPLFCCRKCKRQTSLIAGTIFEGTRTPLRSWFMAIYWHAHPPGMSAKQLSRRIGVTYKTAWLISHKLRFAMSRDLEQAPLQGEVRINGDFYGYPYNHTSSRHPMEHPILVGCSVDAFGEMEHVQIQQLPPEQLKGHSKKPNKKGVDAFLKDRVRSSDVQITTTRYQHGHFRPLVLLCRHMRDWINGIYRGIGPKHLQAYLDQFVYRHNRLGSDIHLDLFQTCAITRTITYRTLIARPAHRPVIESTIIRYIPKNRRHRYTFVDPEPNSMDRYSWSYA